jgi:hypothetical protein
MENLLMDILTYATSGLLEYFFMVFTTTITNHCKKLLHLLELLTGKTPFCRNHRETSYAIYLRVLKGYISFPRGIDSTSKDLISQLCHADMKKRLRTLEGIKNHPYFIMDWDDVANRRLLPPFVPRLSAKEDNPGHYFDHCGEDKNVPADGGVWSFDGF